MSVYRRFGKRVVDLTISIPALVLAAPLILLLGLTVSRNGASPFFGHKRVGRGGLIFRCFKIRSMAPDAEAQLEEILRADPVAAAQWAKDQKLENDPRVTRIGRLLRKSSLDELPQLWNVIRGDMSLVGPRPVVPAELERYGANDTAYLAVRPGITGPWQVQGRNSISYDERVALDVKYAKRMSLPLDLSILAKTGLEVFRMGGA